MWRSLQWLFLFFFRDGDGDSCDDHDGGGDDYDGGGDDIGGGGEMIRTQMKYVTSTHIFSLNHRRHRCRTAEQVQSREREHQQLQKHHW